MRVLEERRCGIKIDIGWNLICDLPDHIPDTHHGGFYHALKEGRIIRDPSYPLRYGEQEFYSHLRELAAEHTQQKPHLLLATSKRPRQRSDVRQDENDIVGQSIQCHYKGGLLRRQYVDDASRDRD
mgnify:CR=1 FL=1